MRVVVFGHGPVGQAVASRLVAGGNEVIVAQRSRPGILSGARFAACDLLDREAVFAAAEGAEHIVLAAGFAYTSKVWAAAWPTAMTNVIEATRSTGARTVFVDNLYMYGPQHTPLREDMALTRAGRKPRVRAEITRLWQQATDIRFAALRAPDFYGPGVLQSHLGDQAFGNLAKGKPAMLLASPDIPHDFAYVPDIARAVVTLLDAPDDAYGQAWHVPSAPTTTPRRILNIGARAIGVPARITTLPSALLPVAGLFSPMLGEMSEMQFQWDRAYQVDASKFANRFGAEATSFEVGAEATARSFAEACAPEARRSAISSV
jgi:nucleoside-diphosphate-sugar epimerase